MHIVVMGCGRVGSSLATRAMSLGHEVAVIDQNADAFRRLGENFAGMTVAGVGFDRDTLLQAGIDRADAFVASTDGDNTNLVIAQIAQRRYQVSNVVVRVLDPARAAWYEQQGLRTVCPTKIAIELLESAVLEAAL